MADPTVGNCSMMYAAMTLSHLRRAAGKDGVLALLKSSGEDLTELRDPFGWIEGPRLMRLARCAAQILGDKSLVGRGIAREIVRWHKATGEDRAWHDLGAAGLLRRFADHGMRQNPGTTIEVDVLADAEISIAVTYAVGARPLRVLCDMQVELYPLLEVLGLDATVRHRLCAARGGPMCLFELAWGTSDQAAYGHYAPDALLERLQKAAGEFARCHTVDAVCLAAVEGAMDLIVPGPTGFLIELRSGERAASSPEVDRRSGSPRSQAPGQKPGGGEGPVVVKVPLMASSVDLGQLLAVFPPGSPVSSRDVAILTSYAGHVAAALEAKRILCEARRDRDDLQSMLILAQSLVATTDRRTILDTLSTAVREVAGEVEAWVVDFTDGPGNDAPGPAVQQAVFDLLAAHGADLAEPVVATVAGARLLVVPMRFSEQLLGAVLLAEATVADDPAEEERRTNRLSSIAAQGAMTLHASMLLERLAYQASHDDLTGLANRQALGRLGPSPASDEFAVLFVDLDRFKQINDSLGHAAGDVVLQAVGRRLKESVRASDHVARIGGDEFVVILSGAGSETARRLAAQITRAISAPIAFEEHELRVSATIGFACGQPGEALEALLSRADAEMYTKKRASSRS